jgi:hypothetical protein
VIVSATVQTPEQLVIAWQCCDTLVSFFDALDARDLDTAIAQFASDGAFVAMGRPMVGHSAIRSGLSMMLNGPTQRHLVTNMRATSITDGALSVEAALTVVHIRDGVAAIFMMLQTTTDFVLTDGRYAISSHSGVPLAMPTGMPPMPAISRVD